MHFIKVFGDNEITFLSIALNASTPELLILLMISDRSVNQEIITIIFTPLFIIIVIIMIYPHRLVFNYFLAEGSASSVKPLSSSLQMLPPVVGNSRRVKSSAPSCDFHANMHVGSTESNH
uniref:Uncharacterized protein n=1 Tax=Glossina austeni TaxID=7395 RepID=A0A1A9V967_GLOAU